MVPSKPPSQTILLDLVQDVAAIGAKLDMIIAEEGRASSRRKEIYERLDEVKDRVTALQHTAEDVQLLKVSVASLLETRQQQQGVAVVLRLAWGSIGGILGGVAASMITWWLTRR